MSHPQPPADPLDRELSAFFRSQVPHPWPAAPATPHAEPGRPAARLGHLRSFARKPVDRARLTLAASVAVLAGAIWVLSAGAPAGGRGQPKPAAAAGPDYLGSSTAKTPDAFGQGRKEKAKSADDPTAGFRPGPIKLP